jgi:short-subunit dehydrogenase
LNGFFDNKVTVITGASSGIGAWIAQELSRLGAIVILLARSGDKLRQTIELMQGKHEFYITDVTSTEQVFTVIDRVIATYGRIDIMINNAGYGVFEALTEATLETIEGMMNVNYLGTVRCTKAVLPYMLKAGSGQIVNIASLAGKIGTAKSSGYSASKHAVLGFTNSLRQELNGTGISVTAVNPGPVNTPFFEQADPTGSYVHKVKRFLLEPEEVGQAVIQAIIKRKLEVNIPLTFGWAAKLMQLFPGISHKAAGKILNKK